MAKCPMCGGDLSPVDENKYKCNFCGYVCSGSEAPERKRSFSVSRASEGVNVYDDNINGVLEITCIEGNGYCSGSGLLISSSGLAITNTHVVTDRNNQPYRDIRVNIAGETVRAEVLVLGDLEGGSGDGIDLALIQLSRVPAKAKVIKFANFDKVRNGEQVYVIGNSLGDGSCITSGIVSDRLRVLSGKLLLMTDCAINGGNSGGPIFNIEGKAVGVIVSSRIKSNGEATEGMNYAIPAFLVEEFIDGKHSAAVIKDTSSYGRRTSNRAHYTNCPRCKSSNIDCQNGIYYCYECQLEW